jgi:hypothetical protein
MAPLGIIGVSRTAIPTRGGWAIVAHGPGRAAPAHDTHQRGLSESPALAGGFCSQKVLAFAVLSEQTGNSRDSEGPRLASMICSGVRDDALCAIYAGISGNNINT